MSASQSSRTPGMVASLLVFTSAALTSNQWLPGHPSWEKALLAGLIALGTGRAVNAVWRIATRDKRG